MERDKFEREKIQSELDAERIKGIVEDIAIQFALDFKGELLNDKAQATIYEAIRNLEQHTKILGRDFRLSESGDKKQYILTFNTTEKGVEKSLTYSFAKEPPPLGTTSSGAKHQQRKSKSDVAPPQREEGKA